MSKGIIVMDIPEYCDYCPAGRIFGINSGVECLVAPEGQCVSGYGFHVGRPDWCPIRPMPGRACHEDYCDNGRYDKGWNDCLKTILKGGSE